MENKKTVTTTQSNELYRFNVTRDMAIIFQGLGIIFLFVFLYIFTLIYELITESSINSYFKANGAGILLLCILVVLTLILHELIHAAAIIKFRGKPRFGAGLSHHILPYLYTTSDMVFPRNQFILIALAPFFVITAIGIILMAIFKQVAQWFIIPLSINISGAIVDLWVSLILVRYPKHVLIKDYGLYFSIYGSSDDPVIKNISTKGFIANLVKGFAVWICSLIILTLILPVLLGLKNVKSFILGIPNTPFILFQLTGGKGFCMDISILPLLAISGLVGLMYALIRTLVIKSNFKN